MAQPNILIVMSDQHNKHVAGCYGDPVISTPHIDRLASRGVLFESAFCPFPLCGPSRMAFMTGRTPSSLRVYDNRSALSSEEPTFAHALGQSSYETILCGRMHFNGPDQRHGFQRRIFPEISGYAATRQAPWTGRKASVEFASRRAAPGRSTTCSTIRNASPRPTAGSGRGPATGDKTLSASSSALLAPTVPSCVLKICSTSTWRRSAFLAAAKSAFVGSVGVPLIIATPGGAHAGLRVSAPVSLLDLAPTLVQMGGAPDLPERHGNRLRSFHWLALIR